MNYITKNKLIEQICRGKPVFIKDTGVAVEVDYFGTDLYEFRNRDSKELFCNVNIIGIPTTKALHLFEKFHIKKNSHTNNMELDGTIKLSNLSLSPYETKAGKVLYEKKKSK